MKAASKKEIHISLEEYEARILMGMIQNPLYSDPSEEPSEEADFRYRLFKLLKREIGE